MLATILWKVKNCNDPLASADKMMGLTMRIEPFFKQSDMVDSPKLMVAVSRIVVNPDGCGNCTESKPSPPSLRGQARALFAHTATTRSVTLFLRRTPFCARCLSIVSVVPLTAPADSKHDRPVALRQDSHTWHWLCLCLLDQGRVILILGHVFFGV